MNNGQNILQLEFFHDGSRRAVSLGEVTAENLLTPISCDDKGSGLKTVIRIYDVYGDVTRLAKELKRLKVKREIHFGSLRKASFFTKWYSKWRVSQLNHREDDLRELMMGYITEHLRASLSNDTWNVARETWGHAFRPARREEFGELMRAAEMAKNFWLFIFEPNSLLADKNTSVVHMM